MTKILHPSLVMGKYKHEFWCTEGLLLINQNCWFLIERIRSKILHEELFVDVVSEITQFPRLYTAKWVGTILAVWSSRYFSVDASCVCGRANIEKWIVSDLVRGKSQNNFEGTEAETTNWAVIGCGMWGSL
jgi:hypothetical protein